MKGSSYSTSDAVEDAWTCAPAASACWWRSEIRAAMTQIARASSFRHTPSNGPPAPEGKLLSAMPVRGYQYSNAIALITRIYSTFADPDSTECWFQAPARAVVLRSIVGKSSGVPVDGTLYVDGSGFRKRACTCRQASEAPLGTASTAGRETEPEVENA